MRYREYGMRGIIELSIFLELNGAHIYLDNAILEPLNLKILYVSFAENIFSTWHILKVLCEIQSKITFHINRKHKY